MAAVLAAAIYSRGVFSPCLAISARRVMVPGESMFHLEPGTILLTLFLDMVYSFAHGNLQKHCEKTKNTR